MQTGQGVAAGRPGRFLAVATLLLAASVCGCAATQATPSTVPISPSASESPSIGATTAPPSVTASPSPSPTSGVKLGPGQWVPDGDLVVAGHLLLLTTGGAQFGIVRVGHVG